MMMLMSAECIASSTGCNARIGCLVCKDSNIIIFGAHTSLAMYRIDTGQLELLSFRALVTSVAVGSDAVLVGCENGDCRLIDIERHKTILECTAPCCVSFSSGHGNNFVFGCIDGSVYTLNSGATTADWHPLFQLKAPKRITALGLLPYCNTTLVIVASSDLSLSLYGLETGICLLSLTDHHVNWINHISIHSLTNRFLTCGQDRIARVWSVMDTKTARSSSLLEDLVSMSKTFTLDSLEHTVTPEAILTGHDDAILSGQFVDEHTIVTSSADRTVLKWEEGEDTWHSVLQIGDIAGIGSAGTGDLYDVCHMSDGSIIAHNTTGSIVKWIPPDYRSPTVLLSGHFGSVEDVVFSPSGSFLLSCSLDRTTRAWIVTQGCQGLSELARPQIHGYEVKSLAFMSESVFVSVGDEKILRVFQATRQFAQRLRALTGHQLMDVIDAGSVMQPALGLSNKAMMSSAGLTGGVDRELLPSESELLSNTLFPEQDKLYGHGDELQCVAVSIDGRFIASSSRTHLAGDSSIRIWDSVTHRQLHVLRPHSLTVVRLSFSPSSGLLLSVSRDRKFALTDPHVGEILWVKDDAHERIIWDGCWLDEDRFCTGSRDKAVKWWSVSGRCCVHEMSFAQPVTAICAPDRDSVLVGLEGGELLAVHGNDQMLIFQAKSRINRISCHGNLVALACADHSIRLISIKNN